MLHQIPNKINYYLDGIYVVRIKLFDRGGLRTNKFIVKKCTPLEDFSEWENPDFCASAIKTNPTALRYVKCNNGVY